MNDVIDSHQTHKNRRIRAIARVLEKKGRVNYKRFLAEMQFNGMRKSVAKEYLYALNDLNMIEITADEIIWIYEEDNG
jgi:hypothetical protein